MFHQVIHKGILLGVIIDSRFSKPGIHFCTPNDFSQQMAYMQYPAGRRIEPHVHNDVPREVHFTKEVLFIRKGKIRVDFYTNEREYVCSHILSQGDAILLSDGGHGFEVLEELEMIEVKQGPYAGDSDKTRFESRITEYKMV